jgi:hypothetical protein
MKKLTTWFDVFESGNKQIHEKDKFKEAFDNLKPGRYIYIIEKIENKRSLEQNNSLWGIPYLYFENALIESGQLQNPSKLQIHEWCLHYCIPEDYRERIRQEYDQQQPLVDIRTGELFKTAFRLTTAKMNTKDMMNYYENLQNFYAEWFAKDENDQIPDPDPAKSRKNIQK